MRKLKNKCLLILVVLSLLLQTGCSSLGKSMGLGGTIGRGGQWMSWIHCHDLVSLLVHSLNSQMQGQYNAVAPEPVTNTLWTKAYSEQLGVAARLPVPKVVLKIVLGEMSELATGSQRVISSKLASEGFSFKFSTLTEALKNLYQWKKRPSERLFTSEQWISLSAQEVFPFFSDTKNLEKITPPWLNFKVLNQSTNEINVGTLINYKISVKGVPLKWRTEIKDWNPPHQFVDDQLKGPYTKWHHTHSFDEYPTGTLMRDKVVYEVPMGRVGQLVAGNYIKNDIANIFSYRSRVIDKLKQQGELGL